MAEPGRAGSTGDEQEGAAQVEGQTEAEQHEPSTEEVPAAPTEETREAPAEEGPGASADTSSEQASGRTGLKGVLAGLGAGLVVGAVAGLAFAGLAKPDALVGPGEPDDTAGAVTAALAGKDATGLADNSCRSRDGQLAPQLPPEALQLIQTAKPAGPSQRTLDSEALAPVDLTLSAQGQTQTLPVDVVLGVTGGEWCMKGITQRQQ